MTRRPFIIQLIGIILGICSFEIGLFAYFNNKISYDKSIDIRRSAPLLLWNVFGQYLFVFLFFQPLYVYLLFLACYFALMIWIDRKIYPHAIALILALGLIKFSVMQILFCLDFINHSTDIALYSVLQGLADQHPFVFVAIGFLLGLAMSSLAPALIVSTLTLFFAQANFALIFVMSASVHLGLSCYYWIMSRQHENTAFEITRTAFLCHLTFAASLFVFSIAFVFIHLSPPTLSTFWILPLLAVGACAFLINPLLQSKAAKKFVNPHQHRVGQTYFARYAFSSQFSGVKLFGQELTKIVVPIVKQSFAATGNVELIHKRYKERFAELESYLRLMLSHSDSTLASQHVLELSSWLNDVISLENNFYEKYRALKSSDIPPSFSEKIHENIEQFVSSDIEKTSLYFSMIQNPRSDYPETIQQITQDLCNRLEENRVSIFVWKGQNLLDLSHRQEAVIMDYLLHYDYDISLLKSITLHWQNWVQFISHYPQALHQLE